MSKNYIHILFILILILLSPNTAAGFHYTTLSVKDGLSSRKVFDIVKDQKGYLWLATAIGVDKYNGEEFVSYTLDSDKTGQRKSKGVLVDNTGEVFAFSEKKIYLFNADLDKFSTIEDIKFLNKETIKTIYSDENNVLWIGTSEGLYSYQKSDGLKVHDKIQGNQVYAITSDDKNYIWIGTSQGVFKLIKDNSNQIVLLEDSLQTSMSDRVEMLYFDPLTKYLWVGTFSNGLKVIDTEKNTLEFNQSFKFNFPIRSIAQINDSALWIGIDGAGIFEFNRFKPELRREYNQTANSIGQRISANNIYDIESDSSHIWVSTYNAGIMAINKKAIEAKLYQNLPKNKNSISDNHVNTILQDQNQNLWFGTNRGVSMYNPQKDSWKQYLQGNNSHAVILTLCEDQTGNILAGGYATILSIINPKTETITQLKNSESGQDFKYVYSIIEDSNYEIWFGGILNKLTSFNPSSKTFKEYNIKGINKILEYNTDTLLLATIKGLVIFDKQTEKSSKVDFSKIDPSLIPYPFLNSISINSHNNNIWWIGTEELGLLAYNIKDHSLKQWTIKDGLSSNNIYGIQFDLKNRLWISTEYGLNCFIPENNDIDVYTQSDGLPSETFNFLAYSMLRNGNMIWGTTDGAIEINPLTIDNQEHTKPKLVFEDFTLFNKKMNAEVVGSPINENIDDIKKIMLNHNQHSFSFDFIDLNNQNHNKVLYTWILEGFDKVWSEPSTNHKAIYTNIPPGTYSFKVQAFRAEDRNIEITRSITIIVKNPFWATGYAFLVYFFLLVLLIYFLHRIYTDRMEARESDKKIKFFINMAHDIRTPLTLIKAPLNEIEEEELTANGTNALNLAKKNTEKLLNMVTQLLDFQKIEGEAMSLHVEKTNISEYIENIATNFLFFASEKQIDFTLQLPKEEVMGWIDRKKLTTILDNLLSNAIKYTSAQGNVQLSLILSENKDTIHIEVTDDGIGISESEQKKLFNRFYRAENVANSTVTGSGIGLLLTKKMVTLHKGVISFSSTEHIGTKFRVDLPISKTSYSEDEVISQIEVKDITIPNEDSESRSDRLHILLVEDNEELRVYLAKYLRRNYEVKEAANGAEALKMIHENNPDFVISDVLMPSLTGLELTQRLKSDINTCHIPIILLTSLAEREDIIKGFNAGADDYITKPFDVSILDTKIQAINKNRLLYKKKYIDRSAFEESSQIATNLDREFMKEVLDKIEDNIANEEFNIDSLALEMAMSRTVFYNKIRSLTGQSPIDIIIDVKMKKAASLLRENKYTISEVAYLTGSSNPKYFSTAFKKYYGVSPSSFLQNEE